MLRGILKNGEFNWKNILNEEQFDKSRTVNQLVLKWRMIKIIMKGELDAMNVKRQKLITKNDWIIAAIKGLEKKNNIHRDLPVEAYNSLSSSLFRNGNSKPLNDFEEVDSESSEESEWPDFFMNISWGKKQSAAQIPPQNYIIPKDRSMLRNKLGSRSFIKKSKSKIEEKDAYKIELI